MYIYLKDQNEKGENMDISKVAEKEDLIDNSHVSKNNEEIQAGKKAKEIEFKTQRFSAQLSSQIKSYIETELKGYGAENMKFTLGGQKFAILENSDKIFQKAIEKGIDSAISDIKLEMENCSDSSGSERERRLDIFFNKTLPNALSSSIDINSATVPERIINEIDSSLKNGTATKIKNINKHQEKVNENINKLVSDIFKPDSQIMKEFEDLGRTYAIAALSRDIYQALESERKMGESTDPRAKVIDNFLVKGNAIDFKKNEYLKSLVSGNTIEEQPKEKIQNEQNIVRVEQKQAVNESEMDLTRRWESNRENWVKEINAYLSSSTGLTLIEQTAVIREIQSSGNGGLETVEERDPNNPARVTVSTRVKDTLNLSEAIGIYNAIMLAQAKTNADESSRYFSEAEIKGLIEEGKGKSVAEQVEISRRINKRGMVYVSMQNELISKLIFENSKTLYNKVIETHHYHKIDPKRFETILTEDEWYRLYLLIFGKSTKEENKTEGNKVELPPPPMPS